MVGPWNGVATVENGMAVPQNIERRIIMWSSSSISGCRPPQNWKQALEEIVVSPSQQLKCGSNPSVQWWMVDKQHVVPTNNGISFRLRKERNSAAHYSVNLLCKWKKSQSLKIDSRALERHGRSHADPPLPSPSAWSPMEWALPSFAFCVSDFYVSWAFPFVSPFFFFIFLLKYSWYTWFQMYNIVIQWLYIKFFP